MSNATRHDDRTFTKSAFFCATAILLSACAAEDQHTGRSTVNLPLPAAIRQITALEGAVLSLEISINNGVPAVFNGQGSTEAWRVSVDVPASQNNTLKVTWIETIEQQRLGLAQQTTTFRTGTTASIIDLSNTYQTTGNGFDYDSDGVSNLAERQNSSDPLRADSGQFVINEPETISITGGCYTMGSPVTEAGRSLQEPAHDICVADFQIGKYEVTFEQYDQFATATNRLKPDDLGWGRGALPVMNINWYDATDYAIWLSEQTNKKYRLPTEAEWEYAARAGTETPFSTGNQINAGQANYNARVSYNGSPAGAQSTQSVPVGSYPANQWGIFDMHGNQSEWTCSTYSVLYTGGELTCNPIEGNNTNAIRGGSWSSPPQNIRSASRFRDTADRSYYYVGFRIAIGN